MVPIQKLLTFGPSLDCSTPRQPHWGFAETAKPVEYIRLLALLPETCYPLTATFFYVVILATFPIQMFPPCSTISIDGCRFGDIWVDSTTQCRHLETKHHIQKLLSFTSSVTYSSFPHRQMGLVSLEFFVGLIMPIIDS